MMSMCSASDCMSVRVSVSPCAPSPMRSREGMPSFFARLAATPEPVALEVAPLLEVLLLLEPPELLDVLELCEPLLDVLPPELPEELPEVLLLELPEELPDVLLLELPPAVASAPPTGDAELSLTPPQPAKPAPMAHKAINATFEEQWFVMSRSISSW